MESARSETGETARASLYAVVTAGCLLFSVVVSWSDLLLVVMGRVIPGWVLSAVVLILSLILLRVLASGHSTVPQTGRASAKSRSLPDVVRIPLIGVAVSGSLLSAANDLIAGADYRVLRPGSPQGCTVVVRETSFPQAGDGDVYVAGAVGLAWWPSGRWTVDDGYRPVAEAAYELSWNREGGTFEVRGTHDDQVLSGGDHTLHCG
jgi:hypothetical protein